MSKYQSFILFLLFFLFVSCQISSKTQPQNTSKFIHTKGTQIVDKNGNPLILRSMGMGNIFYIYPTSIEQLKFHHNEEAYKELADLGFNCVRFLLNYQLFESDDEPYKYKSDGFEWIKRNIEWAKKYNIGIILNMHGPQGGYQSRGEGMELWLYDGIDDGNENQKRLCALWKEIANQCKDEPIIIGYGIVNEPTVLYLAPKEPETKADAIQTAINRWDYLANAITAEIRKVDKNHIIFVENCTVRDANLTWIGTTGFETYPEIDDDNLVYEFHNYNPYYYTHLMENPAGYNNHIYPDEEYVEQNYVKWLGNMTRSLSDSGTLSGDWQQTSHTITTEEAKNRYPDAGIFNIKVTPEKLVDDSTKISGKLFIDDVQLVKIDSAGNETQLLNLNFDKENLWSIGSSDGLAKISHNSTEGKTSPGCLEYSDVNKSGWSSFVDQRFNLEENCSYRITLWYKAENVPEKANWSGFGFDIIQGHIKYGLNYDFLYETLKNSADYFNSKGKPSFCGEFGCKRECFDKNLGGAAWVRDTMSILNSLGLSYSYHAYHEGSFGLHSSYADYQFPSDEDLCVELAEVFKEMNITTK